MARSHVALLALFALTSLEACRRRPPQTPPPAPAATSAPAPAPDPPPPPPPPDCDKLEDACEAGADTRIPVGTGPATVVPPAGWRYAKEASGAFASTADGLAVFGVVPVSGVAEGKNPLAHHRAEILAALEPLLARFGIEKVNVETLKKRLGKPQSHLDLEGGGKVGLWEVDDTKQKGNPTLKEKGGTLLVALASFGSTHVLAVGFVAKPEAESQAAGIMQAIQSLRGAP